MSFARVPILPRLPALGRLALIPIFVILVTWIAGVFGERVALQRLREAAESRLDIYAASLDGAIQRYEYLPYVVSLNHRIHRALQTPKNRRTLDEANRMLQEVNARAKSRAVYVIDPSGLTLASSNWESESTFVGHNYAFRPYFQEALRGEVGRFYGVGTISSEPGYYVSYPIHGVERLLGVAVVKFSLEDVERTWAPGPDKVIVADRNGVVFLSSDVNWRYKTLDALHPAAEEHLLATHQYEGARIVPIGLRRDAQRASGVWRVPSGDRRETEYFAVSRPFQPLDWEITALIDLAGVKVFRRNAEIVAASIAVALSLLWLYLIQRRRRIAENLAAKAELERAYGDLEHRIADRTADLLAANARMQDEVFERQRMEQELRQTQGELVQAGKLAALGEMAAGVTHELNQPLAAMRTLSDNARVLIERGNLHEARSNLTSIAQLIDRMARITAQLKAFARKSVAHSSPVSLRAAVSNTLLVTGRRIADEGVTFVDLPNGENLHVVCDEVGLEQVLTNLFSNALDAMQTASTRRLMVEADAVGDHVRIRVIDSGPGITEQDLPHIFDPFYTTKQKGGGLGLGLTISAGIVRQYGGTIAAANHPGGGAEITIELPQPRAGHDA